MITKAIDFMRSHRVICIFAAVVAAVLITVIVVKSASSAQVCLDPGHGGSDVGAMNGDRYEKDDNLALALAVKDALEEKGIKTVTTRKDDEFVSLEKRCKFANRRKAQFFVALHRNSADSSSAGGVEAWIASDAGGKEQQLASNLLGGLENAGVSNNRGVKTGIIGNSNGDYYVNANTDMPSCLLEVGFISNSGDNELFDENFQQYAQAIADAIEESL